MGSWPFKKNPNKERDKGTRNRILRYWTPKYAELVSEYRKLSRREKRQFKEISKSMRFYVKSRAPACCEDVILTSKSKEAPEYDGLRTTAESGIKMIREYLLKHPEIPENIGSLILKFNVLGLDALDNPSLD